ncbi:MAG: hypothetical protein WB609_01565 [Candidatus Cybelea sp.]
MLKLLIRTLLLVSLACTACGVARAGAQTLYTLPYQIQWIPITGKDVPPGAFYAVLRGKESDKCGQVILNKFPDRFIYPWHVNNSYDLYTVLKGTLVIGFDKNHLKSAERTLPSGSFMQGLMTEPHYGRAIGETIFETVDLCPAWR